MNGGGQPHFPNFGWLLWSWGGEAKLFAQYDNEISPPSCAPGEREQLRACALTGNLVVVLNGRLAYRWMPTCAPAIFTLGTVEYHRKSQEEGQGKETLPGLLGYPKLKGS